jgi:predicted ATP-dependent endonuclease of OLD family
MHLHSYHLQNFRRLRDVRIELADDISIFVGANNSGKTSATQALQMFLPGRSERFSLHDFSSLAWKQLIETGAAPAEQDGNATLPAILLDLWFEVAEADLQFVMPLLPSSAWEGKHVGVRMEFNAVNTQETLQRFRTKKSAAAAQAGALGAHVGTYVPWPRKLTDYLEKELHREYAFRYYVLDRAQCDDGFVPRAGYVPAELTGETKGAAVLESLIRVDCLNAQRHLSDPAAERAGGTGRSESLSRRLSRFYERNLKKREEDHRVLKALFDSEEGLNSHLTEVFGNTLERIRTLGYPGQANPRLEIISDLNPATVMSQDAKVHYVLGTGDETVRLPDSYSGLGLKNLIYMVVEILDHHSQWKDMEENRPLLHLIFIEEPEAHLHAQLQQVFIRRVLSLVGEEAPSAFRSQLVVTTHSPHILYERGFAPIRYFRRHFAAGQQTTTVLNLSSFQPGEHPKDRDFLQRYLKLTHCDLFFADAALLVEGNVERLLLPLMIEKVAPALCSASVCILEVGGAFGHRFKELIEFLGISTLLITDLDSVLETADQASEEEDQEKEFEIPSVAESHAPQKKYGGTCLAEEPGAVSANQTLLQWLPKKRTIQELLEATVPEKTANIAGLDGVAVRVAYQTRIPVTWNGVSASLCGRTLEEAFGLENAEWCQEAERQGVGLRLKTVPPTPGELATGLHKRVTGRNFDKTKFALEILSRKSEEWHVPVYIKEGLEWLADEVDRDEDIVPNPAAPQPQAP